VNSKASQKYIALHAEKISIDAVNNFIPNQKYKHALVVPMYDEYKNCHQLIKNLQTLALEGSLISTFVINHHENSSNQVIENNLLLLDSLVRKYKNTKITDNCFLIHILDHIDIVVFYMCGTKKLPTKQGVGLARKIGCDFICGIINSFNLSKIKWINSTDADATLPQNYFSQTRNISHIQYSACVYNFTHNNTNDPRINQAIALYESSLHQYVNGLKFTGSPYAYHTIGSLISISSQHYPTVRGFPKLSGAEDFYMLNKLAKVAPINSLKDMPVNIQSRLSDRVPFGTGPALKRIIENDANYINQLIYPQICFEQLKIVLRHINQGDYHKLNDYPNIFTILNKLGFFEAVRKIEKNNAKLDKRIQHIHSWFDAFKTLKFARLTANKS
jgi:hypothetical protein